ncbi:putative dihydroxyacetone phosphate acyltransferase [Trypanosoma grayi]|uniref:putative dihydroxyacetone phosphate acyltransferase n=1 Tax=Trypanosoma grayi TaxID=71804 RepID=UPI0004F44B0D|nr:putative dihydroxyacetone phosphate acyltransferase [Trypanosoma grayi]KEG13142.1 putative dihydroxyacetone phosphate acyltransferase [Trypanosoma grayi]
MSQDGVSGASAKSAFKRIVIVANDAACWLGAACAITWAQLPIFGRNKRGCCTRIVFADRFNTPLAILSVEECRARRLDPNASLTAFESLCRDMESDGADLMKRVGFAVDAARHDAAPCFVPDFQNDLYVYISARGRMDCTDHMSLQSLASLKGGGGRLVLLSDDATRQSVQDVARQLSGWRVLCCSVANFSPPWRDLHLTRSLVRQCGGTQGLLEGVSLGVAMGTVKHLQVGFRDPVRVVPLDVAANTALVIASLQRNGQLPSFSGDAVSDHVEIAGGDVLVWGMLAEYLVDYYGRLGPAVAKSFPVPQLIDPRPTLQVSVHISDWINYGISLMMPFQCHYTHAAAQRRKQLTNYLPGSTEAKQIRATLEGINGALRIISTPIGSNGTCKPIPALTTLESGHYTMLLDRVERDPTLQPLYPFISLKSVRWDLYVKVIAQAVVEHLAYRVSGQPCSLPPPLPYYHNDVVFHGSRRAPPSAFCPRRYFEDIHWALRCGMKSDGVRGSALSGLTKESKEGIMARPQVLTAIEDAAQRERSLSVDVQRRAAAILRTVGDNLNHAQLRVFGLLVRKVLFQLYDEISLNDSAFDRLYSAFTASRAQVVLLPAHRSYVDFLIMTYLLVAMGFSPPHVCAGEDFLRMGPFSRLMRGSGAFFMRRSFRNDRLYYTLFREYVRQLVLRRHAMEFFIEGTRSRTGKTLCPKLGILKFVTDAFFEKQDTVDDVLILPISLSYDELLEIKLYADEELGISKPKENVGNLLRARSLLNKRHGKIHVHVGEVISLRQFRDQPHQCPAPFEPVGGKVGDAVPNKNTLTPPYVLTNLAWHLTHAIQDNTVITPTALLSTILNVFAPTTPCLTLNEVHTHMAWLCAHISKRKGALSPDCMDNDAAGMTRRALTHLESFVEVLDEGSKVCIRQDISSFMAIATYSNQLVHVFVDEAVIAIVAQACGEVDMKKEILHVQRNELMERCQQLRKLLSAEFQDYLPTCPYTFTSWFETFLSRLFAYNDNDTESDVSSSCDVTKSSDQNNNKGKAPIESKHILDIRVTHLFRFLTSVLSPFAESLYLVLLALCAVSEDGNEDVFIKASLLEACRECGLQLYDTKRFIVYPQSCGNDSLKNAFDGLVSIFDLKLGSVEKGPAYVLPATATHSTFLTQMQDILRHVRKLRSPRLEVSEEEEKKARGAILKAYRERIVATKMPSKM